MTTRTAFFVKNVTKCVTTKTKNIAGCDHGNLLRKRCLNKASLFIFINCMVLDDMIKAQVNLNEAEKALNDAEQKITQLEVQ
ncbi:hypothetical protein E2R51_17140 [Jeotgalibacillus sp. S-D1]|uniref:hypothetical protein n=1 Tax=Jeotgalibacillus sp. S-D1 TaxID=2552189 RepID=UPI00105A33A8|nr:hypothetical protein [Jeotgalibacillus sp. S-D1]TDL30709.1 hypothetical protein E2R51_17140 [Jeotgalibacillus sp. S-D1]